MVDRKRKAWRTGRGRHGGQEEEAMADRKRKASIEQWPHEGQAKRKPTSYSVHRKLLGSGDMPGIWRKHDLPSQTAVPLVYSALVSASLCDVTAYRKLSGHRARSSGLQEASPVEHKYIPLLLPSQLVL